MAQKKGEPAAADISYINLFLFAVQIKYKNNDKKKKRIDYETANIETKILFLTCFSYRFTKETKQLHKN